MPGGGFRIRTRPTARITPRGSRNDHVEMKSIHTQYLKTVKSSVVRVSGGIDWTSSSALMSQIDHCLTADHPARLIVDLNDVVRIDSSGVGALVGSLQQAKRMHVQFTLCGVNPSLHRLLQRTCLDRVFEIRQTIAEALQVSGDAWPFHSEKSRNFSKVSPERSSCDR